jgi:hypothetical protein
MDPFHAHGAFGQKTTSLQFSRDIKGARVDNVLGIDLFEFIRVKHCPGMIVYDYTSGSIVFGSLPTGGLNTVPALIREKIPYRHVVRA